ncbi:oxidoreductase [Planotetraspora silvatica]|uniref:Oxidoreductase n=1 Tax=Planotetraspora silvatica TaxID=234614 RepID=A0A8J3UGM5_9ACTN|nr:SDR family NAD(P)-dependent oxidoreductase [Planotetraspora silvatica]GII44933.1 oxidoreductase [Planotetraspora silvatica]
MRLAGARVLVTGASSGIGAATALAMAGRHAHLVLAGRDRGRLAAVAARTGGEVLAGDLPAGAARLVADAGPVDVLVSNAGEGWCGPFTEMPAEAVERLVGVNLAAPIHLTRLLLPAMIERGRGHLVFVASIAGAVGVGEEAVYSAAKAGLMAFAEALRYELRGLRASRAGGRGGAPRIEVTVVVPGVVDTPFFDRRGVPYGRRRPAPIPPERVARAVVAAVEHGRAECYVPGWLRLPARMRGALPGPFRALAGRTAMRGRPVSRRAAPGSTP